METWESYLTAKALNKLRKRPRKGVQLIHMPSFGDYSAVTISMDRKGGLRAHRLTWKRRYDLDENNFPRALETYRYFNHEPLITFYTFIAEPDEFMPLYHEAFTQPVPLDPESQVFGLDGVIYELWLGDSFSNVNLTWWWQLPEKWACMKPLLVYLLEKSEIRETEEGS